MRRVEVSAPIAHAPRLVFVAIRDEIERLAPYMGHIESMSLISRETVGEDIEQRHLWRAKRETLPLVIRPFATAQMVSWRDRGRWSERELSCRWEVEPLSGKGLFSCTGTTLLADDGAGGCVFRLTAELQVRLETIPGLPRFLAEKVRDPVERWVARSMEPNLTSLAQAANEYLAAR